MNFIKKIFDELPDEECKLQLRRFGKGIYENRALVDIAKGKKIKIKTSFEFANFFVRVLGNTIKSKTKITGGVITTKNLDFGFNVEKKQFAGVKTYLFDKEFDKDELFNLMDKNNDLLFFLSFKTEYGELKCKVKTPKAGKPAKKDEEEPKADFCVFSTGDLDFVKEFTFDVPYDFKKCFIKHKFLIEDLTILKEYENDFEKARMYAVRKGKLIRELNIDGNKQINKVDFNI